MALTIGIRNDIVLPLGKEVAQCSHAICAFVLGCFDFENRIWRKDPTGLLPLVAEASLSRLPPDALAPAPIRIVDAGHTVFAGVPTLTTGLFFEKNEAEAAGFSPNPHAPSAPRASTDVRMVLVSEKQARRALSPDFSLTAARLWALEVLTLLDGLRAGLPPEQEAWLTAWRSGAFAKIVLNASPGEATDLCSVMQERSLPFHAARRGQGVLFFGPAPAAALGEITRGLKLV